MMIDMKLKMQSNSNDALHFVQHILWPCTYSRVRLHFTINRRNQAAFSPRSGFVQQGAAADADKPRR